MYLSCGGVKASCLVYNKKEHSLYPPPEVWLLLGLSLTGANNSRDQVNHLIRTE